MVIENQNKQPTFEEILEELKNKAGNSGEKINEGLTKYPELEEPIEKKSNETAEELDELVSKLEEMRKLYGEEEYDINGEVRKLTNEELLDTIDVPLDVMYIVAPEDGKEYNMKIPKIVHENKLIPVTRDYNGMTRNDYLNMMSK